MTRALVLLLLVAGCTQPGEPNLGLHLANNGKVYPSAAADLGGVWVGGTRGGGAVGTRLGPVNVSAGF